MFKEAYSDIYLAGGCFWGIQAYYKNLLGVLTTEVGYANGHEPSTNYHIIGQTGHAETVHLTYDRNRIHLAEILDHFYRIIDPKGVNKQGNDKGPQYRTGIYYNDPKDRKTIELSLKVLEKRIGGHAIEQEALRHFVVAEEYHQDYLGKNPNGYCHINLKKIDEPLSLPKENWDPGILSNMANYVSKEKGTEPPFSSPLSGEKNPGLYVDIQTGQPLFSSDDKYDAGCGWPSFTMPITTDALRYEDDYSHQMQRVEVRSKMSHLGHIFPDGPRDRGGFRYCINGASLKFISKGYMESVGYGDFLPYVIIDSL